MVEERKNIHEGKGKETCEDGYTEVSKMWEDSYSKLYKPWFESTEALFKKAFELSKDAAPETYKEFYDEWVKTSQNSFGKFYQESTAKYLEVYGMWVKSYGKMLNELLTLPFRQNMKFMFENIKGTSDTYSEAFEHISKIWKDSYTKIYVPYTDSMMKLSSKSVEIFHGNASPQAYKEFHTLWMNTYQETYGRLFDIQSMRPKKEVVEYFVQSENVNLNICRSWIEILGKLSQKAERLSKQNTDPEAHKELYNLWAKMYGKAFENFFENTPAFSHFSEIIEPMKNAAKVYTDTFTSISCVGIKSEPISIGGV
jgi:hypothetical protein